MARNTETNKYCRQVIRTLGENFVRGLKLLLPLLLAVLFHATGAMAQGSATRPQVKLPDGPLRSIILKNCVQCHGIDDYAFHALTRDRWSDMLDEKHKDLDMNRLTRRDRNALLDYLAENFGEDYSPFPREYVPPEITTFYNDDLGRLVLDETCTECHALDRVYETRGTIERWRVLLLEMRGRGAVLSNNEDMERLAEWLSRVQSANTFE
jgi:hypothetical protein